MKDRYSATNAKKHSHGSFVLRADAQKEIDSLRKELQEARDSQQRTLDHWGKYKQGYYTELERAEAAEQREVEAVAEASRQVEVSDNLYRKAAARVKELEVLLKYEEKEKSRYQTGIIHIEAKAQRVIDAARTHLNFVMLKYGIKESDQFSCPYMRELYDAIRLLNKGE